MMAGAPAPAPASPSEYVAVERFISNIEKPPVAYQARRRLEASSTKLQESAWLDALTEYAPASGFSYQIVAHGGSERIRRRVLISVLEAEKANASPQEWGKASLSRDNYDFMFDGRDSDGMIKVQLNPRRRDSRLVRGTALLSPESGELMRVEGQLSKSPSFWVRWVRLTRNYSPIAGSLMPAAMESTADVRIAGVSNFSMTYDYRSVAGVAVASSPEILASR